MCKMTNEISNQYIQHLVAPSPSSSVAGPITLQDQWGSMWIFHARLTINHKAKNTPFVHTHVVMSHNIIPLFLAVSSPALASQLGSSLPAPHASLQPEINTKRSTWRSKQFDIFQAQSSSRHVHTPKDAVFTPINAHLGEGFDLVKKYGFVAKFHQWLGPRESEWPQSCAETSNKNQGLHSSNAWSGTKVNLARSLCGISPAHSIVYVFV